MRNPACCSGHGSQPVVEPVLTDSNALPSIPPQLAITASKEGRSEGERGGCQLAESIGQGRSAPDRCWLLNVEGVAIMHEPEVIKIIFVIAALQ